VLGCAIRGLQRNAAIRQRAANLHDDTAIAREHPFQRGECAVNVAKVSDFSHTPEFFRRHLLNRRKNRRHRVVDPDIDLTEFRFDLGRR
jgi:hypothetical protein